MPGRAGTETILNQLAQDVSDGDMGLLDMLRVVRSDDQGDVGERREFSTVAPGQGDDLDPQGERCLHGPQDVR